MLFCCLLIFYVITFSSAFWPTQGNALPMPAIFPLPLLLSALSDSFHAITTIGRLFNLFCDAQILLLLFAAAVMRIAHLSLLQAPTVSSLLPFTTARVLFYSMLLLKVLSIPPAAASLLLCVAVSSSSPPLSTIMLLLHRL